MVTGGVMICLTGKFISKKIFTGPMESPEPAI